jgi:SAM-dependent MidA family methyltransferase
VSPLAERIRREILERGPIPFARFMERALYDPEGGYYARGASRLGPGGDFYTASDVGRAFGGAIARQLLELDRAIGPLEPFHVVELGAGRGLLARDVIDAMDELDASLASRLRYDLVDRSRAMLDESRRRVPEARSLPPEELEAGHEGCVLAVELFDALPVHRVRRREGVLRELFVGIDDAGELVEVEGTCTAAARASAERYGAAAEEGTEAEVAPLVEAQIDAIDRCLRRGVLLVVDYGERAADLYGRSRPEGTLLAYRQHGTSRDYLRHVGEQDLTAHVNFSALEDAARARGFHPLGLTTQDRFLIANGILETFAPDEPGRLHDPRRVKERMQALQLIHPEGMGRRFKVLALAKGCRPDLAGLRDPFA